MAAFGTELRLIGEAMATGERVGANASFWYLLSASPTLCRSLAAFLSVNDPEILPIDFRLAARFFPSGEDIRVGSRCDFETVIEMVTAAEKYGMGRKEWIRLAQNVNLFRAFLLREHMMPPYSHEFVASYGDRLPFAEGMRSEPELVRTFRRGNYPVRGALFPVTTRVTGLLDIEQGIMRDCGYVSADAHELLSFARSLSALEDQRPWSMVGYRWIIAPGSSMYNPTHECDTLHFCSISYRDRFRLSRTSVSGAAVDVAQRKVRLQHEQYILGVQR